MWTKINKYLCFKTFAIATSVVGWFVVKIIKQILHSFESVKKSFNLNALKIKFIHNTLC